MTTVTIEAPTPVAVLNNKKRFAQALDARDAARTVFDKVKSAPRAARQGLMSLFRALHLDSFLGSASGALTRWISLAWEKAIAARNYIGRLLGWRLLGVYALTDTEYRNQIGRVAGNGYLITSGALGKVGDWIGMVPIVGPLARSVFMTPLRALDRIVYRTVGFAKKHIDAHADHSLMRAAHKLSEFGLFSRLVRAFIPSRYRFVLYLAYWFRPAKTAYDAVREDEVGGKISEQVTRVRNTTRAAAAEVSDAVVDRVMDGPHTPPAMHITQPGVEILDITVIKTGERLQLPVTVDVRGQKWVTWDSTTYAVDELPDEIGILPVDLATQTARLDEARRAADANGGAPHNEPRAVARALAATAPRKSGARARAGKQHR